MAAACANPFAARLANIEDGNNGVAISGFSKAAKMSFKEAMAHAFKDVRLFRWCQR